MGHGPSVRERGPLVNPVPTGFTSTSKFSDFAEFGKIARKFSNSIFSKSTWHRLCLILFVDGSVAGQNDFWV
jgi:hypothetical protein